MNQHQKQLKEKTNNKQYVLILKVWTWTCKNKSKEQIIIRDG